MRHIQAPAVEINEFDRSLYGKTDYSLPNSPVCLYTGFADKGPDYVINWIDTKNTLDEIYGYPTNEAERYFYNTAVEILGRGGRCLAAKLPYYNKAKDKYVYTSYTVATKQKEFPSTLNVISTEIINVMTDKSMYDFMFFPNIDIDRVDYFISEDKTDLVVKDHETSTVLSAFTDKQLDESVIEYFLTDYIELDLPARNYKKDNVADLLTYNGIYLDTITDLFNYIDDVCDFDYSAERIFLYLFYNEDGMCKNNAVYLLSAIYEDSDYSVLSTYNTECSAYVEQISSMVETFKRTEQLKDFNSLYISFCNDHNISYFKLQYERLIEKIERAVYTDNYNDKQILMQLMESFINLSAFDKDYSELQILDSSVSTYLEIKMNDLSDTTKMTFDLFDDFKTGVSKPEKSLFYIVDITRGKYSKTDILSGDQAFVKQRVFKDKEILGIVPVVTTPVNALMFLELIQGDNVKLSAYNPVSDIHTAYTADKTLPVIGRDIFILTDNYSYKLSSSELDEGTISEQASKLFPTIGIRSDGYLDRDYLKQIGVVVFKAYKDTANNNKIGFTVLESFVGSLDRNAEDINTHANLYIGNLINNNSQYINFFSSVKVNDKKDMFDTYMIKNLSAASLGFYESECEKDISYSESINKPLNIILEHANNAFSIPLDLVLDAGVSNIAQFIRSVYWNKGYGKYDFYDNDNITAIKNVTANNTGTWKNVLKKFDNFVKNVRKDCMFLADGIRSFALIGEEKRVRRSAKETNVMRDVIPNLKYMNALDSSYSAGYCNWFWQPDSYTSTLMWMPPSVKAAGVYIYTDVYYRKWDAPAGVNRGIIGNTYDVSFNPNIDEAGKIYNLQWNYAISYPVDGIILEGLKTFLKNKTALDRVNVRRLMLYLEKQVIRIGRKYLYEGNTAYLRQQFVDAITVVFEDAKDGYGIIDYAIKCDDDNNTPETIDHNELHVKIAVKPVKTLEFLVCDFIVTNLSANVQEEVMR